MLVKESLNKILSPKQPELVIQDLKSLDPEKKEKILFNKAMEFFLGSYDDVLYFLLNLYPKNTFLKIKDMLQSAGIESPDVTNNEFRIWILHNFSTNDLIDLILGLLSNKELDLAISTLWPEYDQYIK